MQPVIMIGDAAVLMNQTELIFYGKGDLRHRVRFQFRKRNIKVFITVFYQSFKDKRRHIDKTLERFKEYRYRLCFIQKNRNRSRFITDAGNAGCFENKAGKIPLRAVFNDIDVSCAVFFKIENCLLTTSGSYNSIFQIDGIDLYMTSLLDFKSVFAPPQNSKHARTARPTPVDVSSSTTPISFFMPLYRLKFIDFREIFEAYVKPGYPDNISRLFGYWSRNRYSKITGYF